MKTLKLLSLFAIIILLGQSCLEDQCNATSEYVRYNPVYMTGSELTYEVSTLEGRTLLNPGKIYFYQKYLFINERGAGIHIYNNEDPNHPEYVTFYSLPGNFDMAIKNNTLFTDNPLYLMSIDISDLKNPILSWRKIKVMFMWLSYRGQLNIFMRLSYRGTT